ncbi:uncharacterized protein LOC114362305 [Ostrinia furnacalis]|uniref:uncharacterized protein LOC114362305 n=1 Tax=Ostrinia furnacalis TaxID=93504 RepID=UPI00103DB2CE|nr:uncharacterized protein LOC114362305 [Ostrinia furnacalis]
MSYTWAAGEAELGARLPLLLHLFTAGIFQNDRLNVWLQAYTWADGEAELGARLPLLLHLFTAGIFQNDRRAAEAAVFCSPLLYSVTIVLVQHYELGDWCAAACDGLQAYTWAGREAELGARLPLLLHLFTAGIFQNDRCSGSRCSLPGSELAALASGCCRAAAAWLPPAQLSHVARAALLRAPGLPCDQLAALASGCCRAAAAWLPPAQLSHVARAALLRAPGLPCDQLGHLLRELGVIWWEVRSGLKGPDDRYAAYAPHVAQLLSVLHRAFVAAAVQLSYAPERVAALAWSSLLEAWSAWVVPHAATPLLPSTGEREHYTCMLRAFHEAALEVMADCPGTEEHLLCQIFEWAVQTCASVHSAPNQESRGQASALLAELARGPWRSHQWLRASSLQALLQVCHLRDRELNDWCAAACDGLQANTWAGREAELGARLPLLLHLFTAGIFQNDQVSAAIVLP